MKKYSTIHLEIILSILLSIFFFSCQKISEEEIENATAVSVDISTRVAEETDIQYPVNIYAFTIDGKYVDMKTISSVKDDMNFNLAEGDYRLVAVSGLNQEYEIVDKPEISDVINITNNGYAKTPLMHGMADVTLKGKSAEAIITMTYTVAEINILLSEISDADQVKVSLSSHYPNLSLDGKYNGESLKLDLDCSKDQNGNWIAGPYYIFPGYGDKTVFSISIIKNGKMKVYGYTYSGTPQANHPFNAIGNYNGTLKISGSLVSKGWEDPINVKFSFGDSKEEQEETNPEVPVEPNNNMPKVGDIWNDCIVAAVNEVTQNSAKLLLFSIEEWEGKYSDGEKAIDGYSINEIGNWRLPSYNEAKLIRDTFSGNALLALNDKINKRGMDELEISTTYRYLCKKGSLFYSFQFNNGKSITQAGSKTTYLIRPVKTFVLESKN